ncbi:MAG: hypothetical protein JRI23_08240 [Deltaproteobacteria bacterium]|jgi:hypothetical protein|nr:hypothetical protein [Deltaproteobacteria bacterium]MBW2531602.1 hypothetical protein [Deltaproteobacteria bacterium]
MKLWFCAAAASVATLACGDSFTTIIVNDTGGQTASGGQGGDAGGTGGTGGTGAAGGTGGGEAGATPVCPANGTSHVTDSFDDGSLAEFWAPWGDGITETGGTVNITFANGVYSQSGAATVDQYDLRNCDVVLEVLEVPNPSESIDAYLDVHADGDNIAYITFDDGGFLEFHAVTNGVGEGPVQAVSYSPSQHRWWRIAERNGNTLLQTAPDGASWQTHHSFPTPSWVASVKIEFYASSAASNLAPGAFRIDNLNPPP